MTFRLHPIAATVVALAAVLGLTVAASSYLTERDISAFEARVATLGVASPAPAATPAALASLPPPVQRYVRYTFPEGPVRYGVVRLSASGEFRRPLTQDFQPTTAGQVIAAGVPALMFSATTPIAGALWARAYDFFADGEMEMKAKILSTLTVVDEKQTPMLNEISLRRWLLESPLYPAALLPGGPVTWEALDEDRARAVVTWGALRASMVAHFDSQGRLTHMQAETDGDLSTPYHGSGEHVQRSNYQRVGAQVIPMDFTISRLSGGKLYPFWKGRIDRIDFQ